MIRLLSVFLLSLALAFALAPQSFAEDQAQKPLIKIYKAPG